MLVVCAGMIRSGSTLQYNLICSLLEKMGSCEKHGTFDAGAEWLSVPALTIWAKDSERFHVIKDHGLHSANIRPQEQEMVRDGLVRICYTYRDVRDVAASAKEFWGAREDRLFQMLDQALSIYENLQEIPGVLHQRYEELVGDLPRAVRDIAQFLGCMPTPELIEEVVRECSLETMETLSQHPVLRVARMVKRVLPFSLNGSRMGGLRKLLRKYDKDSLLGARKHISSTRGAIGTWRNKLTRKEQEVITARYKKYLIRAGYSVSET